MTFDRDLVERLDGAVVGRRRELELLTAALAGGRHILLEGPPGTGKSTVLRSIAEESGTSFEFVEGNAELTPARLVGTFDPARVLTEGYAADVFLPGPLARALTDGGLLYIEEINRVPEETLNVLITVMSEGELHVPRLGMIRAGSGFRLVAAMNPFDAIGTARISGAVYDRCCRLRVDYQDADSEAAIVNKRAAFGEIETATVKAVVALVRATRDHPDIRTGSSVRGAIDLVIVMRELTELRGKGTPLNDISLDATLVALSGRIRVRDGSTRTAEQILTDLWAEYLRIADPESEPDEAGNSGKATRPA